MGFKDFLINEATFNVGIDPSQETVQDAMNKAKMTYRIGKANPRRAMRMRQREEIANAQNIKSTGANDPLTALRLQINKLEQRLSRLKQTLYTKEQQQTARQ